jgi:plastocyanin
VKAHPAILVAAALGLLSCSGPGAGSGAPPPATHTVTIESLEFKPADLTVRAGDTIVWVNKDPFPHTATAKEAFDSKDIAADKSWTFKAAPTGEFSYVCTYHPTMKGTVRVK